MGDWSKLLHDLLVEIARRVQFVEDFVAFGGVCTSWRAAAAELNGIYDESRPQVPFLMLAEKEGSDDREFYSLSKGKICRRLSLPETKGKRCIESRGWLLTVGGSGEVNLFHPFSRVQIELPNQKTFPQYEEFDMDPPHCFIEQAVLSSSPTTSSDFVVMVIHSGRRYLGFWRPGDRAWTRIESRIGSFSGVNYYDGKFYAIDYTAHVWVWDVSEPNLTVAEPLFAIDRELIICRESYLVESSGQLLIVARNGIEYDDEDENGYGVTNFRVVQLDLVRREWKEIRNLETRAIFVGYNSAFSIDVTSFPGIIKPNCIYFTDDSIEAFWRTQQGGGKDMGVYHLEDGQIERFDALQSFSFISPPQWVMPSF